MNGALLLLPLYYQQVRGESVLFTGILMIPRGIGMLLTRSWVGGLADRMGSRSVGFAAAAFIPSLLLSVHPKETPVKQA
nr:hypothetical protein [Paenibacillus sp. S150]